MENAETELIFEDLGTVFATEGEQVVESEVQDDQVHPQLIADESGMVNSVIEDEGSIAAQVIANETEIADSSAIQMEGEVDLTALQSQEFVIAEDGTLIPHNVEDVVVPEVEVPLEDQLKSNERLDRSSPDLWPTNLPTTAKQILHSNQLKTGESDASEMWTQGLDPEDINLLHQFGSLTSASLVEEVKKLQNIAHQLAMDEKKEMTRGKLLHVLEDSSSVKDGDQFHFKSIWK